MRPPPRVFAPGRLLGVDLARGVALLGMMAIHIFPSVRADGSVAPAYLVASGRASALFAVLAGLSLVLATRTTSGSGGVPRGARAGVLARAAVIGLIGLTLGVLPSGVAVILVNYAVLFAVGALLLGLRTRTLAVAAGLWVLISPVLSHLLRQHVGSGHPGTVPSWLSLAQPLKLLENLLLTGYYPVLTWTGYLLVGMLLGRAPLREAGTAWLLAGAGLVLAAGPRLLSGLLLGPAGGAAHLTVPPGSPLTGRDLDVVLATGSYGTAPATTWWWLASAGSHSGTQLDLLHTIGTSAVVLGACLLLARAVTGRARVALLPLAAAGSMTLTLYTLHVVVLAAQQGTADAALPTWLAHTAGALVLGGLWQLTGRSGPLEALASEAAAAARPSH